MMNVLHVQVRQIVYQEMQVQFTHHVCFIEEEGWIIVQGLREWRIFILE